MQGGDTALSITPWSAVKRFRTSWLAVDLF